MKNRISLLLPALCAMLLPSCASQFMDEGLTALNGQPIRTAFGVIGYPTSRMELSSGSVYAWDLSTSGVSAVPTYATATTNVGLETYTTTVQGTQMVPYSYSGNIKLETDRRDIIVNYSWNGQIGAVVPYANALHKYAAGVKRDLAARTAAAGTPPPRR